ncbi:sodium-dependent glucose transporter 1-like isoform X2 [Centruroides sculpturatus]|nr:sodium-dependent glucose transporter 1-like isoform X2 [Centruroides sculpturatus]XP_023211303.1 sodium-dependent glucose transporter 1-like isoform X2 [Centruroides sculpturatus]
MTTTKKKVKIIRTINLFLSFFGLGMCVSIPGPTLLELQRTVNTDSEHISFIYIARSSGYLFGSIVAGVLLDRFRKQLIIVFNCLLIAISIAAIPWWTRLLPLIMNFLINGIAMGALDTGNNVYCLDIWKKESGPYLQALHFFFGLGAFIAPLIAEPFLPDSSNNHEKNSTHNSTYFTTVYSELDNHSTSNSPNEDGHSIHFPYGILGCYVLFVVISHIIALCIWPKEEKTDRNEATNNIHKSNIPLYSTIISLTALFMCMYSGLEIAFGQLLTTFAVKGNLHLSESTGSFMTSVYWGTYTFARAFSIFLVTCTNLICPILVDLALFIAAGVCLSLFGGSSETMLWIGIAVLGFGLSSVFPSVLAWLEFHIPLNSKVASLFIVGVSLGEMVVPLSISHFIDKHSMALMYATLLLGCGSTLLFIILWLLIIRYKKTEKIEKEKLGHLSTSQENIN